LRSMTATGTEADPLPWDGVTDPLALFRAWITEAESTEINDPNAMALATAGRDGLPDVRIVLLKSYSPSGFVFYTNSRSQKGAELGENMQAAAVLHWKSLQRQVRIRGPVCPVPGAEADEYFASRPHGSKVGAWASQQSQPLPGRPLLEEAVEREHARFAAGEIPRPPHWAGYRITPIHMEFWVGRQFRLHDRLAFDRDKPGSDWRAGLLYP
jgi:pyridoxamine 5'-phosphate oxidase